MRASLAIATGVAAALFASTAHAQVGSSAGGSTAGSVGASGGVGATSGTGGVDASGGIGGTGSTPSGVGSSVEPIVPGSGLGAGGGSDANATRATEGGSSINSLNVDGLARSGTGGSAVTTTLGDDDDFRPTAGAGTPQEYRIPTPTVAVDLGAIRRGMAAAPSATPKPNGD